MSAGLAPRARLVRALAATTVVLTACAAVAWDATDGLRAWTTESARRLAVTERPVAIPAATLEDQHGRTFRLDELRGQVLLVDFIYTNCRTLCVALGSRFKALQQELSARGVNATLISISIDPDRDTPPALLKYATRFHADEKHWRVARVNDAAELERLLNTFGVISIPDGRGEFQHNAAIHVVDNAARLTRILGLEAPTDEIVAAINSP